MSQRTLAAITAVVGVAVGFAAGRQFPSTAPPPAPASPAASDTPERPALAAELQQEREARAALEQEIVALRAELEASPSNPIEDPPSDAIDADPSPNTDDDADPAAEGFDGDELLAAGVPAREVERLRDRFDAFELDLLYLQDEANRDGWDADRLRRERRALRQQLRAELGDDDYDAMLFAAGRRNRVVASDILAGSAAEQVGIRAGDAILQYGDERIFDALSLLRATREGEAGELTEIRLEREGRVVRVFVPRGPVGIRLGRERRLPDTAR